MQSSSIDSRLKSLIASRIIFVTILLGTFFFFQIGFNVFPYPAAVLYIIIVLYSLSIVYAMLLGNVPGLAHAYMQMIMDSLAAIALIIVTGGIESWFSWLLLIVVFSAAVVINRRAAYIIATLISLLYGAIIDMQFYGVVPIPYYEELMEKDFLYKIFSHITGLYLIAMLTGQLTERIVRKDIDFEELSLFNRDVIENTPSGLFTTSAGGKILVFNHAAESITSVSRNDASGKHISSIFPLLESIQETSKPVEAEMTFKDKTKTISLSVSSMKNIKGKVTGYIGMFQDITDFKALSHELKQKESLANVGELSAKIAHEIRNPLASLKGSVEMLKEGTLGTRQSDKLMDIALSEMDRLNSIITDFLSYARPTPTVKISFDVHQALDEVAELLKNRDKETTNIKTGYSGSLMIKADRHKLMEVFWNLGINAIDAMHGAGTLTISTALMDDRLSISFSDTGEGIEIKDQQKIFFPFYTTKFNGTGLGLSTAYRVAEDHGGKLTVASSPGEGSTFTVIIPIDQ